jgi:hypothetical protein
LSHVYVVEHAYETPVGTENIKLIGVYSSEANANDAIARLSVKPGLCDHTEGFHVSKLSLDKDQWADGFISWKEAVGEPTRTSG